MKVLWQITLLILQIGTFYDTRKLEDWLSNADQENCTDSKKNKSLNSGNIQEGNSLDNLPKLRLVNAKKFK